MNKIFESWRLYENEYEWVIETPVGNIAFRMDEDWKHIVRLLYFAPQLLHYVRWQAEVNECHDAQALLEKIGRSK